MGIDKGIITTLRPAARLLHQFERLKQRIGYSIHKLFQHKTPKTEAK